MNKLLAKSYDRQVYGDSPPDYALLTQHSRDVAEASRALARIVGPTALHYAGIPIEHYSRFAQALEANGWLQDLGKANSDFQSMVNGESIDQMLRHETVSVMLASQEPEMKNWLAPIVELEAALWGAAGHHRKFDNSLAPRRRTGRMQVFVSNSDVSTILNEMADSLALAPPPVFASDITIEYKSCGNGSWSALGKLNCMKDEFEQIVDHLTDSYRKRLIFIVKALGIAADVSASAVARESERKDLYCMTEFVEETIGSTGLRIEDLDAIIAQRLGISARIEDDREKFQAAVAQSTSTITLAQGGCGTGKSIAAYRWARHQCELAGRDNFRLFFCLPTTGTTTEHFKDYALESGIAPSLLSLTHSRSSVDLRTISVTHEEAETDDSPENPAAAVIRAQQDKIEALSLWDTPLVVTTVDTVLGLAVNARRATYSSPAIFSSAVVFDEIHAYDDTMFGHMLQFIKNLPNMPILLMTASLPKERLAHLLSVRPDLKCVPGPPDFERLERYHMQMSEPEDALMEVEKAVTANEKILWVCNRVDWANATYRTLFSKFQNKAYINVYHSRFRYKDRSRRHREVLDEFQRQDSACILVATQVAEMSLDLSADLLVTDLAPVPALIQRMGRLNRKSIPSNQLSAKSALVLPVADSNAAPYTAVELDEAGDWVTRLAGVGHALSQEDLSNAFAESRAVTKFDEKKAAINAVFFSRLWQTYPGVTRDRGYTVAVILEQDFDKLRSGKPSKDWLREHEVAIPFKPQVLRWQKPDYLPIAPSSEVYYDYDESTNTGTGAEWL